MIEKFQKSYIKILYSKTTFLSIFIYMNFLNVYLCEENSVVNRIKG